jgi:hypothetical protein
MTPPASLAADARSDASVTRVDVAPDGRVTQFRLAGREWLAPGGLDEGPAAALERTIRVQPDGSVRAEYAAGLLDAGAADGAQPAAWLGRLHLPLLPGTRLDLPVAARVRVWDERGVALGGRGADHRWPVLRVGARDATPFGPREVDFTFPALAPQRFGAGGGRDYAGTFVLDLPQPAAQVVRVAVEQDGARLELALNPAQTPHLVLWIDCHAGTLALAAAVGAGGGASTRHVVTWRGRAASAGA